MTNAKRLTDERLQEIMNDGFVTGRQKHQLLRHIAALETELATLKAQRPPLDEEAERLRKWLIEGWENTNEIDFSNAADLITRLSTKSAAAEAERDHFKALAKHACDHHMEEEERANAAEAELGRVRGEALEEARAAIRADEERRMLERDNESRPAVRREMELIRVGISVAEKIVRALTKEKQA